MNRPWNPHSDFEKSRKRFNFMFNTVMVINIVIFVAVMSFIVFVGVTAIGAVDEIQSVGLKAVIERIWCGPGAKCL